MQNFRKIIYLPIETKSREFDSKCLIALGCVEKGAAVVMSAAGASRIEVPGVILLKSAAGFELDHIDDLKGKQMKCAVIDEEGFVQTRNEKQRALRYAQSTIDLVDRILFNGAAEQELLRKFYVFPDDKGVVTGNVRFDFYKPQFHPYYRAQADQLQAKYGRYILLTSRFGNVTPARKVEYLDFLKNTRGISDESDLQIFRDFFTHSKQIYQALLDLVPELSRAFREHRIVIRPHPSEAFEYWVAAAGGLDNVVVEKEGPIGPWVLGADAVLHNGCTTGLEAFLMGRPVFSYMPFTSEEFDLKLPNTVSIQCYDKETLLQSMRKMLTEGMESDADHDLERYKVEFARHYLNNAGDNYAHEKIAGVLCALATLQPMTDVNQLSQPLTARARNRLKKIRDTLSLLAFRLGIPQPAILQEGYYNHQKNPGFSAGEVRANLEKLAAIARMEIDGLVVRKLDENVVLIYANNTAS